jgi:hypothetical protein
MTNQNADYLTCVKPLSLASPIVILAEHGELTLVVVTNKNPGWVPDGGSSEEFLAESMSTRRVFPPVNRPCGV